ncbi:MAG: alpha/beta hydrolase [Propionibacteriaceae bacterium]|nr:alpha/beta hydrolase [Propionibacteriaceae bacterium]
MGVFTLLTALVMSCTSAAAEPVAAPSVSTVSAPAVKAATTSTKEQKRSAGVKNPKVVWAKSCKKGFSCGTVKVPLDYDDPKGTQVSIALVRLKATNQAKKIGVLFVNPGGPGSSGITLLYQSKSMFSKTLRTYFDIVGFDPRGIGKSTSLQCFASSSQQYKSVGSGMGTAFPVGATQQKKFLASAKAIAVNCSKNALAKSMSTAEVARDLDVLRRAFHQPYLTYLGFSYGSYIGSVYASLYPDRVRAIVMDGVVEPVAWAGTKATKYIPSTIRIGAAKAAQQTLEAVFTRCVEVGAPACPLAPDPATSFNTLVERIKVKPLPIVSLDSWQAYEQLTLESLYTPAGIESWATLTANLLVSTDPKQNPSLKMKALTASKVALAKLQRINSKAAFGYNNSVESFSAVLCTDSRNPTWQSSWAKNVARADAASPHFGRIWLWESAVCATKYWTGKDEDAYRGPFNKATRNPLLLVGSPYDAATNYDAAATTAARLPNAYLMKTNTFGHTSYGYSECATSAIDAYLVSRAAPPAECPADTTGLLFE